MTNNCNNKTTYIFQLLGALPWVLLCLSLGGFSSQGSGLEQSDHREMKTVKLAMSRLLNALITIGCQERVNNNE
jgi:hypothetical protein